MKRGRCVVKSLWLPMKIDNLAIIAFFCWCFLLYLSPSGVSLPPREPDLLFFFPFLFGFDALHNHHSFYSAHSFAFEKYHKSVHSHWCGKLLLLSFFFVANTHVHSLPSLLSLLWPSSPSYRHRHHDPLALDKSKICLIFVCFIFASFKVPGKKPPRE